MIITTIGRDYKDRYKTKKNDKKVDQTFKATLNEKKQKQEAKSK